MNQIASNDKEVGQTILEYERAKFKLRSHELKLRQFFPSMSPEELDRMTGAFVNVASATLGSKLGMERVKDLQPLKVNKRALKGRQQVASGSRPPIKEAIVRVMGAKVMHTSEVLAALEAKGWAPAAKDPKQYVGYVLSSATDFFARVKAKGRGFYKVKAKGTALATAKTSKKKATKAKATPKAKAASKVTKDEILRHLVKHGSSFTSPEVAEKLGIDNTQRLVPLFNSLKKNGGLKTKENKDGEILWIPVAAKIKAYDAERGGSAFNGATHANGVS